MLEMTPAQTADLKELGNIGSGYAVSRLSDLLGVRCLVNLPEVVPLGAANFKEVVGTDDDFAVALDAKGRGEFECSLYLVMRTLSAEHVIRDMARAESKKAGTLVDLPREFALKKMGEKMLQGYLDALNDFLKTRIKIGGTELTVDLHNKALDRILRRLVELDGEQVLVQSGFSAPDQSFEGAFALILNRVAQFYLFTSLGQLTKL